VCFGHLEHEAGEFVVLKVAQLERVSEFLDRSAVDVEEFTVGFCGRRSKRRRCLFVWRWSCERSEGDRKIDNRANRVGAGADSRL
jgi:hypothetical protein